MTKKYFTVYENDISYWYLANVYRPHKVKYHHHAKHKNEKSYRMMKRLERPKVKKYCREEYYGPIIRIEK